MEKKENRPMTKGEKEIAKSLDKYMDDGLELRITGDDFDFTAPISLSDAGEIITFIAKVRERGIKKG